MALSTGDKRSALSKKSSNMNMPTPAADHLSNGRCDDAASVARHHLDGALRGLEQVEQDGTASVRVQAFTDVAHAYRELCAYSTAEWYLQQALRVARTERLAREAVDVLCLLAETAAALAGADATTEPSDRHSARERARDQSYEATLLAARCDDRPWEVDVLMRVAEILDRCGDHDDAVALHARALERVMQPFLSSAPAPLGQPARRHA
jgi:hypothetical protein